jgi:thiamine biosynthesis lipoprotein
MKLFTLLMTVFLFMILCSADTGYHKTKKNSRWYISHYENVLGTSLELKFFATSQNEARTAETAALDEIGKLNKILSGYDANSEFSIWLRTSQKPVHVSAELFEVLNLFDQWRVWSGGALNASAEVINRLWKQSSLNQHLPSTEELAMAVREAQRPQWKLDIATHTATHIGNAPLMLNSFAKSYIIKHAVDAANNSAGVSAIVVNIGGDMVISGKDNENIAVSNPRTDADIDVPIDRLIVSNKAVATSGNYRRGELINGLWYSHIVDPRTGQPADSIISATVIASNATDAGALATAFNVMKPSESIQLASRFPGIEYLIITKNNKRISSSGWNALEVPFIKSINNIATDSGKVKDKLSFDNDFELMINLEINVQKQGFVKRPYVAVWIEDENHAPVRTIAVWHGSDRYLPELKSWYLKYRGLYNTDKNFSSSSTSATRSAGKYTLKWDGKDDQGNYVKPGKYIIKIEASREHGTYQLMRQEMVCDDVPKVADLTGNTEIASASLDYRKKTGNN